MTLKRFHIGLHKGSKIYSPGELVSGELTVETDKRIKCRGIKLNFMGKTNVHWTDYKLPEKYCTATELHMQEEIYVYGSPDSESVLKPDSYVFPFFFKLPNNIPSTLQHDFGQIYYSISAVMNSTAPYTPEMLATFIVESGPDLNEHPSKPIVMAVQEAFHHRFAVWKQLGSMEARVKIPSDAFAPGESIKLNIDLDQGSGSVEITKIILNLQQTMIFHAARPPGAYRADFAVVETAKRDGPFDPCSTVHMELRVPPTPCSSLQTSPFVEISYILQVVFVPSGNHDNCVVEHAIIIGRRPAPEPEEIPEARASPVQLEPPEEAPPEFEPTPMPSPPQPYGFNIPPYPIIPAHPLPERFFNDSETVAPAGTSMPLASAPPEPYVEPPPSYESVMAQQHKE